VVLWWPGPAGTRLAARRASGVHVCEHWRRVSWGTAVVQTTGFRDGGWLDIWGSPLTDRATITERFRRLNYGMMKIDVTIDDPKAYTKPFSVRVNQRIMPDGELIEFICNENNKAPQLMVGK
jgi:hypothetical protein